MPLRYLNRSNYLPTKTTAAASDKICKTHILSQYPVWHTKYISGDAED